MEVAGLSSVGYGLMVGQIDLGDPRRGDEDQISCDHVVHANVCPGPIDSGPTRLAPGRSISGLPMDTDSCDIRGRGHLIAGIVACDGMRVIGGCCSGAWMAER